jgi:beta-lactam-binding protein with PASTA domain
MLSGRWPAWLLVLAAAGMFAAPSASAQTRPVTPTVRPTTTTPAIDRTVVEPAVRMARGCPPLPDLVGRNVDDVLPKLSPELFRPRVNPESSSQPRGVILRQPTTQLIEGRLCYLDIVVSDGSLTRVPPLHGATAEEAERRLAAADLRISIREKASDEPAGRVFEQKPGVGDEVPRRSTVVAVLATSRDRVRPADAAAAALAAAIAAATRDGPPRPPEPEPAEETCLPLPDLSGQNVDAVLPTLGRRHFRPRISAEPSTELRGTILRQPTTAPIDGSLCYVDFAVSDGSLTRVPELHGATAEQAESRLAAADLRPALREVESSAPEGRVFDQKPRPGDEVPRQSTVDAVIARPELFDVPAVVGQSYEQALAQLERFAVTRNPVASRRPPGEVTDQEPRTPARRPAGAAVRLDVSDGSLVVVPPVERQALDAARAELAAVDLRAEALEQEGDLAPGVVASQDPEAGTEVSRGSTVRLEVSTGLPVPDVVGRQITEAAALLDRFRVEPSTVRNRAPEGQVIDQQPGPPARVAAGAVVQLGLSDGSLVLVPPVELEAHESARAALDEADLRVEVEERAGALPQGVVESQDPAAGSEVSRGSVVRLVVSTGRPVPRGVDTRGVDGSQTGPPTDGRAPVIRDDGNGSTWPRWLAYVFALLAGSGLFYAVRLRLRPPPAEPEVSARVESDPGSVALTNVGLAGPEIQLSARIDAGDSQVRLEGDSP